MAMAPMDVDSGCGSSSQAEECLPPIKVVGEDSKALASASNSSSSDMVVGPLRECITVIEEIQELSSSDAIWNKSQCKRIADRCRVLAQMFGMMVQSDEHDFVVGQASSGGCSTSNEAMDELLHVLQKVKFTISGYVNEFEAQTHVLWWTNNPTAFVQLHEELDAAMVKNGFLGMEDAEVLNYGVESKMNMFRADAEEDRKEMPHRFSQVPKSGQSEKLEQVVSDRTADLDVKDLDYDNPDKLPSYLKISQTEIIEGEPIRIYTRESERDPKHEVGWAEVKRGKLLDCDVAIKVFNCGAVNDRDRAEWNQKQLLMEAGSLVELSHPHVVQLVGFGQYETKAVFAMECMDGDLRNFMTKKKLESDTKHSKPFTDSEELEIITQIARGMCFIHKKGYAHGDLKCSNLVVSSRGQFLEVKIADLRGSQKRGEWKPKAFEQASRTRRPRWTAPEALDGWDRPRSWEELTQMDIYSFGMTCYEIVTSKYPFDKIYGDELVRKIKDMARPELPEHLDEQLRGLITSCWDHDPAKRPSFVSICRFLEYSKSLQKDGSSEMILLVMLKQFTKKMLTWWEHLGKAESRSVQQSSGDLFQREHLEQFFPESGHLEIDPEELIKVKRVDRGASKYSRVYKITWLTCTFAEKELRKLYSRVDIMKPELEALIKVSRHPYLVYLVGLSVKPKEKVCSIVMEYIDGNLRELMDARMGADGHFQNRKANLKKIGKGPFDFHEELQIVSKIALGMAYLHSRNLVHRDLKSVNVLAQEYVGTNPTIVVKIADFGLSHLGESHDASDTESVFTDSSDAESNTADPRNARKVTKTPTSYYNGYGTAFYRAPEMLLVDPKAPLENLSALGLPDEGSEAGLRELKATDVFSFAMTCYEVLTGIGPCSDLRMTEYSKIRAGHRPTWPESPKSEPKSRVKLKELVQKCWETIPHKRPTFDHICKELLEISKLPQV